jgi:hypothetical protein
MTFTYLLLAVVLAVPIGALCVQAINTGDPGVLGFTVFFLPFFGYAVYKFGATKYEHLIFDTYEGNSKSTFRMRKDNPSPAEVEKFIECLKAEAMKIRYRDELPDDKKLELVQRHLEYLQHVQVLSAAEVAEFTARAKKRLVESKVSVLHPTPANDSN